MARGEDFELVKDFLRESSGGGFEEVVKGVKKEFGGSWKGVRFRVRMSSNAKPEAFIILFAGG